MKQYYYMLDLFDEYEVWCWRNLLSIEDLKSYFSNKLYHFRKNRLKRKAIYNSCWCSKPGCPVGVR